MKKVLLFFGLVCLISLMYSCSQDDKQEVSARVDLPTFPSYDAEAYGLPGIFNSLVHQNCCECSTSGCSAHKCCSGGFDCTCTCINRFWGTSECSCSKCTGQQMHLYLTERQFATWQDFAGIIATEQSGPSILAMEAHLKALDGIAKDSLELFRAGKVALGVAVQQLNLETKSRINNFLETYNFEDEQL